MAYPNIAFMVKSSCTHFKVEAGHFPDTLTTTVSSDTSWCSILKRTGGELYISINAMMLLDDGYNTITIKNCCGTIIIENYGWNEAFIGPEYTLCFGDCRTRSVFTANGHLAVNIDPTNYYIDIYNEQIIWLNDDKFLVSFNKSNLQLKRTTVKKTSNYAELRDRVLHEIKMRNADIDALRKERDDLTKQIESGEHTDFGDITVKTLQIAKHTQEIKNLNREYTVENTTTTISEMLDIPQDRLVTYNDISFVWYPNKTKRHQLTLDTKTEVVVDTCEVLLT